MPDLPCVEAVRKSGDEPFRGSGMAADVTLRDYWRWSTSDLLSNATRGVLAEYLVAVALGLSGGVRREWDVYDLVTQDGLRIEVKSSAYLQSWFQRRVSRIAFSIRPARAWDYRTNVLGTEHARHADPYIFALLHHKDKRTVDPMDLSQWTFHVAPTSQLNRHFPAAKSIGLEGLKKAGAHACQFDDLRSTVQRIAWAMRP